MQNYEETSRNLEQTSHQSCQYQSYALDRLLSLKTNIPVPSFALLKTRRVAFSFKVLVVSGQVMQNVKSTNEYRDSRVRSDLSGITYASCL